MVSSSSPSRHDHGNPISRKKDLNVRTPTLPSSATPDTTTGLRAQIADLLPRHSYFHLRLHIQQLSSVPFVGGEFGVRWKLKGVHAPPRNRSPGLLARVTGRLQRKESRLRDYDADVSTPSADTPLTRFPHPTPNGVPSLSSVSDSSPSPLSLADLASARGHTSFLVLRDHTVTWDHTLSTVLRADVERSTAALLALPIKLVVTQRVDPCDPASAPQNPRLGAVYLNLSEYVGQGAVQRRYLLRESKTNATLKLTIEMEHIGGEARYVSPPLPKGEILTGIQGFLENDVYRMRSRTANLYGPYRDQAELEMDLLGAPRHHHRRRTTPTALGTPSTSSLSSSSSSSTSSAFSRSPISLRSHASAQDTHHIAFDVHRLPVAYGTKTTEALIDSLFNPVRTTERQSETPFTYYVEPMVGLGGGVSRTDTDGGNMNGRVASPSLNAGMDASLGLVKLGIHVGNGRVASTDSTKSSLVIVSDVSGKPRSANDRVAQMDEGRVIEGAGVRGWWRKLVD